jgi:uncharacterized protein (TIGR03435 family)
MIRRFPALFLLLPFVAAAAGLFGQVPGIYGPATGHPAAGDSAPELTFSKVLSAPSLSATGPVNFLGKVTVLAFYPNTTANPESVARWNALVSQFAGQSGDKAVQFIWITGEKESSVGPLLTQHPVKGFVLLDAGGATGRAYGMDLPAGVIIGTDGRIVGFDRRMVPEADTLKAAMEGRVTTTPVALGPDAASALAASHKVFLDAKAPQLPDLGEVQPKTPPSYEVHISPAEASEGRGTYSSNDFWNMQGYELKDAISELYDQMSPMRIELPASLEDGKRYDISLVLPEPESREQMAERIRKGIEDHFFLTATRENRLMDVYVVTAPNGKPPAIEVHSRPGGGGKASGLAFRAPATDGDEYDSAGAPKAISINTVDSVSVQGSADEFCQMLERVLDRPVVNETGLQGEYSFRVEPVPGEQNDFLYRLQNQTGLEVTTEQRNVEILVFNPR